MNDAGEAEHMLSVLMGSNVAARKSHIAKRINNLFG
jgi:DNA gyrase/topoisomerase IV subunit B